jgi:hypothetical protein
MFVAFRAITYSSLFIGLLLIYLPTRVLSRSISCARQRLDRRKRSG